MIKDILFLSKVAAVTAPFILLALLSNKANLKKSERQRQCFMPIVAVIYCIVAAVFLGKITNLIIDAFNMLHIWIAQLSDWVGGLFDGKLSVISEWLVGLVDKVEAFVKKLNLPLWAGILANSLIATAYVTFKTFIVRFIKLFCKDGKRLYELFTGLVYYKDERKGRWFVKPMYAQGVTLLKVLYIATLVTAVIGIGLTAMLFNLKIIPSLYFPVFGVILVGELFFYFNGEFAIKEDSSLEGEADRADEMCDYTLMRNVLRRNFGDKLLGENTTVNNGLLYYRTNEEVLSELEDADETAIEAYAAFMERKTREGLVLDQNYLMSGLELLKGKSIVFNNPFYYDLVPYIFYPMNRTILRRKKVLIVLGRHAVEGEIEEWCRKGLTAVNYIPSLWNIGVLGDTPTDPEVGIVTRSKVHDLKMHEANAAFFADVEFVVLVEPSKLVATAQIGLNSLVRHCRRDGKRLVFCSTDKNCDGIVDALSHILMTSLEEVSATNRPGGTSSYMCWEVDEEHLQHRMLPNLARYLGVGTELSFTALKNQISKTYWYGGDAFPVLDMRWIAKQYHYDLLRYAALPAQQSVMDEVFRTSSNMWDATAEDYKYVTVEDENHNMFEVQREFSTRAKKQGFINVISTDYLLKDYMAANDTIFHADSKAIPYIVADYANTERNVLYRLCLRLASYPVLEEEIRRELVLIDMDVTDIAETLWQGICRCSQSFGHAAQDDQNELHIRKNGKEYVFSRSVIEVERKYSYKTGRIENLYSICNETFVDVFMGDLCNAEYIAEDEKGETLYLGSELRGHIFQKYLPGQFFTFGGKYYEMLRLSGDGKVIVRRAADHIDGRPQYRQVRRYVLHSAADTGRMGDIRDIGGIRVSKMFADLSVETPAYWSMKRYNDFADGRRTAINGVPVRDYRNKQILKIEFGDTPLASPAVIKTVTLLMNEIFRTLYADNQDMIVAVTAGDVQEPLTYSLDGAAAQPNCVYIIEDSQLDIGLLVSVERNLNRIFSIMCDYLQWHTETLEESLNPPTEEEPTPDYTQTEEDKAEEKKKRGLRGFFGRIGAFFKKLFRRKKKGDGTAEGEGQEPTGEPKEKKPGFFGRIGVFFKKLFGRKPKKGDTPDDQSATPEEEQAPTDGEQAPPAEGETNVPTAEPEQPEQATEPVQEEMREPTEEEQTSESYMLFSAEGEPTEGEQAELEFEAEQAQRVSDTVAYTRKPYHERYYLLYGYEAMPSCVDVENTLALLKAFKYDHSFLEQARNGRNEAEKLEKSFDPNRAGSHYCDFCGVELLGTEYEVLADGRERCMACGRTAVKTEEEFKKLYEEAIRNMKVFYGVVINEPVNIKMVNAKKLHSRLGKSFVPTGKADGRVLGVAIKDKNGYSILLENGSPRIKATMTMVHELTHIWQYLNWNDKQIKQLYGKDLNLQVYEGMAKWSEIQYAYLINEPTTAKREEIITRLREDEYGYGFNKYVSVYPLSTTIKLDGNTPFDDVQKPL